MNSETNPKDAVVDITGDNENERFEDAMSNMKTTYTKSTISHGQREHNSSQKHSNNAPTDTNESTIKSTATSLSKSTVPNGNIPKNNNNKASDITSSPSTKSFTKSVNQNFNQPKEKSNDGRKNVSNDDIMNFMREFQATFVQQAEAINAKIDTKINDMQMELTTKINDLATSVDERFNAVHNNIETHAAPIVEKLVQPITQALETRIDKLERESLLLELVITGFPLHQNEILERIVDRMCTVIGFESGMNGISGFYRVSRNANNKNRPNKTSSKVIDYPPIILKFWSFDLKQYFFKRYLNKKTLNLSDFGYSTTARIYINESLTASNHNLLMKARSMQKDKIIHQCHTYKGQVFVKVRDNSANQCILSMDDLLHLENAAQKV